MSTFRAKTAETTASRWAEYRAILTRCENPKAGDAEHLAELVERLGIDPAWVEVHAAIVKEHHRAKAKADGLDQATAKKAALDDALAGEIKRHNQAVLEHRRRLVDLQNDQNQADIERLAHQGAAELQARLEAQFPDLLGTAAPSADAPPTWHAQTETIRAAMERAGIHPGRPE